MSWIGPKMRAPLPQRTKPLRAISKKRRAETKRRRAVRQAVIERDGYGCAAQRAGFVHVCEGPMDFHELRSRAQMPGGHLEEANVVCLCRASHSWVTEHPLKAFELGLLKSHKFEAQR